MKLGLRQPLHRIGTGGRWRWGPGSDRPRGTEPGAAAHRHPFASRRIRSHASSWRRA